VAQKRQAWREAMPGLRPDQLAFLDETGTKTNMARAYGRRPRGQRLVMAVPHGHWKATTFAAALRVGGLGAPTAVDGAMDSATFRADVEQQLAPTSRPGDLVVMDNLSGHKGPGVEEAIARAGARLEYLPPYSPDLNPIEQAFAKLKAFVRKTAERTVEGLWRRLGEALDEFSPRECENLIRHCGYGATAT
jgi:transposase